MVVINKYFNKITLSFVLSIILNIYYLQYQERISAGGFVPLYQGPTYYGAGRPLWIAKLYEDGSYQILWGNFVFNTLFFFLIAYLFLLGVSLVRKLVLKRKK